MPAPFGESGDDAWINAVLLAREFFKFAPPVPAIPVPVESYLRPHIEAYIRRFPEFGPNHRIEVRQAEWKRRNFNSSLIRTGDLSTILVHKDLNWCYTRFATAIELSNILQANDNSQLLTTDIVAHLSGLLSGISPKPNTPLFAERESINLAIELLMPMHYRSRMDHYVEEGLDAMSLAVIFRIPKTISELSLNGGWQQRVMLHESIGDAEPLPPISESMVKTGLVCPKCKQQVGIVLDNRPKPAFLCPSCGHKWSGDGEFKP